ncbi:MAG TPA: hypothetical protein VFJ02_25300 [Vicinamibacterales bacterium]|nr:hypothetical protein [Vicinamibacterales bacterium]
MRSISLAALLALSFSLMPARADALTLREVIELSRAGLGDEVLLALIEIDQRIFPIDPDTLRALKEAGVSERVIVAIVKSGRTPSQVTDVPPVVVDAAPPLPPEPQVVYVEREHPIVREVAVPVAVYIPVPVRPHRRGHADVLTPAREVDDRRQPPEPVYWGWGGKLRPDAWQPTPTDVRQQRRRY